MSKKLLERSKSGSDVANTGAAHATPVFVIVTESDHE